MKKFILASFILLSMPLAHALDFASLKKYYHDQVGERALTRTEQINEAIRNGNVKQVLRLVNAGNTNPVELAQYISLANRHFGLSPEAKVVAKGIGITKMILGAAIAFKALDYYREKWGIWVYEPLVKDQPGFSPGFQGRKIFTTVNNRWRGNDSAVLPLRTALHNVAFDIAAIGGVISAYGGIRGALNHITPKCDMNSHLLIRLYLQSLVQK